MKRSDDYEARRKALADLSDDALRARFWELTDALVEPLLQAGYGNTSPAVERSVLLRMGFSSVEAGGIVSGCLESGLLGHGAGNVVYRLANARGIGIRAAGLLLCAPHAPWDEAVSLFGGQA